MIPSEQEKGRIPHWDPPLLGFVFGAMMWEAILLVALLIATC